MWPDRVSNPGPLTYESGALPTALRGPAMELCNQLGRDWVVRWCWVNFQWRGVLLIWIRVGQGLTALAVGACGG